MEFAVLGPLEVRAGGAPVRLTRPRERRVLAALLVRAGGTVSTDWLVDAVWEGGLPQHPARAVQTVVSRLRSVLGENAVVTTGTGYRLAAPPDAIDAVRFERRHRQARALLDDDPGAALDALDEALALWRGPAYGEFAHESFARAEAARLEELRAAAEEARVDARLALGDHGPALEEASRLVGLRPFDERPRHQLALALYRSGRQVEALAALRSFRGLLADELGLEPSPALGDLEHRILTHRLEVVGDVRGPAERGQGSGWEHQLDLPATTMVGRDEAVSRIVALLDGARLVTLTGPGGVGKTRLAAGVAAVRAARDPVGAASLAPVQHPGAVAAALATALGVRRSRHRSVEESLVDSLGHRRLLVVLDNCEHVIEAVAHLVRLLLSRCPEVRVLATSRERLGLVDEHVVDVPPLPVGGPGPAIAEGSAVALFAERARAAGVPIDTELGAVAAAATICAHLDGLPLAVELAAAQVRIMSPADIADRLERSAPLFLGRARGGSERHRSLRAVVDWSYDLLTAGERELFDGLSVFAGSFDLEAVEGVAASVGLDAGEAVATLAALVEQSLVAVQAGPPPTRYALLETLRSYGAERLAQRRRARAWQDGHARYYADLARRGAEGLAGADEATWMRRLAADTANLREALRWGLGHQPELAVRLVAHLGWLRFRTMQTEVDQWAEDAVAVAGSHPLRPLLLGAAALGAWSRGELDRARRLAEAAVGQGGEPLPPERMAYDALGAVALVEGHLAESLASYELAGTLARRAGDRFHELWTLAAAAVVESYQEPTARVASRLGEAATMADDLGCPSALAFVAWARGEVLAGADPRAALALFDRSEALAAGVGNHFVAGLAGLSATTVRARLGDLAKALPRFAELIEHWRAVGNRTQLWIMLRTLVHSLAVAGHREAAAVLLGALEASTTSPPSFGPDRERLAASAAAVAATGDPAAVEAWLRRGRTLGDEGAIAFALETIGSLTVRRP